MVRAVFFLVLLVAAVQSYTVPKAERMDKKMTEPPMMMTSTMMMEMSTPEAKAIMGSTEMMPMKDDMATTMASGDMAMTTGAMMEKGKMDTKKDKDTKSKSHKH